MAAKASSEAGRDLLKLRFSTVETVFGNIKENLGYRGVRLRGIDSFRGEWLLMCIGHNLNRLFTLLRPNCLPDGDHSDSSRTSSQIPFSAPMALLGFQRLPAAA